MGSAGAAVERLMLQLHEVELMLPQLRGELLPGQSSGRWSERGQELDEHGRRVPAPAARRCPDCGSARQQLPGLTLQGGDGHREDLPGRWFCPNGCDSGGRSAQMTPDDRRWTSAHVVAPGVTRAPLAVSVLDDLADVGASMVELEDHVRERLGILPAERQVLVPARIPDGWHPPMLAPPPEVVPAALVQPAASLHPGRPAPQVLQTRDPVAAVIWLASTADRLASPDLRDLLDLAVDQTGRAARVLRSSLGRAEQVRLLKYPCPFCDSMSLRLFVEREVIACVNEACRFDTPEHERCGCQDGRRHRWPRHEWDYLADQLGVDLEPETGAA